MHVAEGLAPLADLARLYVSGWWCDLHAPRRQKGLPDLPPAPGWPIHRQPPPDHFEAAAPPAPSTDRNPQ